ncbi:hypothetical protein [Lacticaseibacillus thailandensis]|uniref:hypothetical protein n=1 Tax=Lacticaseibacillus thailandensis TaxID=381741 RepID=UPI000A43EC2E|nr:hypothetical protein [Lacticaseibacillus thailandensis]
MTAQQKTVLQSRLEEYRAHDETVLNVVVEMAAIGVLQAFTDVDGDAFSRKTSKKGLKLGVVPVDVEV